MKTALLIVIVIGIIVAAGAGVGGFFAGKAYERNQADTARRDFFQARGLQDFNAQDIPPGAILEFNSGNEPPGAMGQGRVFRGGGAIGSIKSIDGNTLTLTTPQDTEIKIILSDTTRIEKTTSGVLSDLTAGLQVAVNGQRDADGNITAVQVTIIPAESSIQVP